MYKGLSPPSGRLNPLWLLLLSVLGDSRHSLNRIVSSQNFISKTQGSERLSKFYILLTCSTTFCYGVHEKLYFSFLSTIFVLLETSEYVYTSDSDHGVVN